MKSRHFHVKIKSQPLKECLKITLEILTGHFNLLKINSNYRKSLISNLNQKNQIVIDICIKEKKVY
jgi:hypothetical protein